MRHFYLSGAGAIAIATAAVTASAQSDTVQRGPIPEWVALAADEAVPEDAEGLVFARRSQAEVRLTDDSELQFTAYRTRVLHPAALEIGNVQLSWNPSAATPTVHVLKIHRDGQEIDVLADNDFEILRREQQLEKSMLDGTLTAVLRVPDLRVGDELEFAATTQGRDPTFGDRNFGVIGLFGEPPQGNYRMRLSWTDGNKPTVAIGDRIAPYLTSEPGAYTMAASDPSFSRLPADSPARYFHQSFLHYSDFTEWDEMSRFTYPFYSRAATLSASSPVRQEAARIAAAHSDPADRMAAALELVQSQVRYVYVGLSGGNYTPASADETWNRRYGDCKGKTVLLLALLQELGIEADPVLVSNSGGNDGLEQRPPSPGAFDHVVVRAQLGAESYYLDGTLPAIATASTRPLFDYRYVLPLTQAGHSLEKLSTAPRAAPTSVVTNDLDASAGFDEPARYIQTTVKRGPEAIVHHMQLSALTASQLETALRSNLTGSGSWVSVDKVAYRFDRSEGAGILEVHGTVDLDWEGDIGDSRSLALIGGGFSPPAKKIRSEARDKDIPFTGDPEHACDVTTIRFPDQTDPLDWSFNGEYEQSFFGRSYYRAFERKGDTISMVRGLRRETIEVSVADAAKDNERIDDFENSKAIIYHDPGEPLRLKADATPVPAASDPVWRSKSAPCLPGG